MLNANEPFEFLTCYSLKHEILINDFMELSRELITHARSLLLSLKVLGSFLFGVTK